MRDIIVTRLSDRGVLEEILAARAHDVYVSGMGHLVQQCDGHDEDEQGSFAARSVVFFAMSAHVAIVKLAIDPDRAMVAWLALRYAANVGGTCKGAIVERRDYENYIMG